MSGNADMHWGNGLTKYVEALSGTLRTYGIFDEVPRWPRWIMLVSLVLVGSTLAVAVLDRRTTRRQRWTIFACAAPAVALFIFFVFLYSSVEVRGALHGESDAVRGCARWHGCGLGMGPARHDPLSLGTRHLISGFAVLVCMWAIAQVAIVIPFQQALVEWNNNTRHQQYDQGVCRRSTGARAHRVTAASTPAWDGMCRGGVTSEESAILRASEFEIGRAGAFIVWRNRLDLGEEWTVIDRSSEAVSAFLDLLQRERRLIARRC